MQHYVLREQLVRSSHDHYKMAAEFAQFLRGVSEGFAVRSMFCDIVRKNPLPLNKKHKSNKIK